MLIKGIVGTALRRRGDEVAAPLVLRPGFAVRLLDGIRRIGQDHIELAQSVTFDEFRVSQRVTMAGYVALAATAAGRSAKPSNLSGSRPMPMKKADRQLLMLIGIAVCVAILWWAVSRGSSSEQPGPNATTSSVIDSPTATVSEPKPPASPGTEPGPSDAPTPASCLPTLAESALPLQGFRLHKSCSARTSPSCGRPSQG